MNITEKCIDIEIRSVYDGVCVKYYPDSDEFVWRNIGLERTTEDERKSFENKFRDQMKSN